MGGKKKKSAWGLYVECHGSAAKNGILFNKEDTVKENSLEPLGQKKGVRWGEKHNKQQKNKQNRS